MNMKRNLWRKKEDRCRVCKWRHMELLSTRRAWHTTCQWSDPSQHVTSSWHAASYWSIRSNTALWLVSFRVPGILSITASPQQNQDIDLKTWSCYRAVIDSKGWQQMFSSGKGGIKKERKVDSRFLSIVKILGRCPFYKRMIRAGCSLLMRAWGGQMWDLLWIIPRQ